MRLSLKIFKKFVTLIYFKVFKVKGLNMRNETFKCAMCLDELGDDEELRLFPHYSHIFYLDYIDIGSLFT